MNIDWKKIGNNFKILEKETESYISPDNIFIVRLDGCCFSTFTRGFEKPFDFRIVESLEKTTADLVTKFNAKIGFCQSDEISLLFDKCDLELKQIHMYNGRIQKLCSILASYTSLRFTYYLKQNTLESKLDSKINNGVTFDARIIKISNRQIALDCFLWRQQYDCSRNAIMAIAQKHYSPKQLHKISPKNAINMLKNQGIDIYLGIYPNNYLYGTYIKRILITKPCIDYKTGSEIQCIRTETKKYSQKEPVDIDFLFSKYVSDSV
jgi:tRNA(His) guanylyltransferase